MKTILLLDDDENILSTFGLALRHHGYRVIEANSGDLGLELARKHLPDLIITDISMPGSDGQAVLTQIRQDPELSSRQVVLMTGQTHLVTPRRGMEIGADDFLTKPVSLGDLMRCVEARFKRAQIHWRVEDRLLQKLRTSLQSTLPHELFTPLGGIIGLADILRSDYANLSPGEVKELLNDIHASGLRLHRTLRNYLLMLDMEGVAPQAATVVEKVSGDKAVDCFTAGVREAALRNDRVEDVRAQFQSIALTALPGDLCLVAEELADNACKFSAKGTPIDIRFSSDGVFSVQDQGRGMSEEEIEQLGSFQQFDRKRQEQQGLGLGLALVKKLAAKCGARFTLTSEPSKGTLVRVCFQTA